LRKIKLGFKIQYWLDGFLFLINGNERKSAGIGERAQPEDFGKDKTLIDPGKPVLHFLIIFQGKNEFSCF
jgi:hypothetical protein